MNNDDLAQMIQNEPVEQQTESVDLENTQEEQQSEEVETSEETEFDISVLSLTEWFENNHRNFPNVNPVKVAIRGHDSSKTLIFSVLDPKGEETEDGHIKVELEMIKGTDEFNVLDLPGIEMDVYSNGFKIIYNYENYVLKCYGVRTGLIVIYCINHNGNLLPYAEGKLGKKDEGIDIVHPDTGAIRTKLSEDLDIEDLQLMYKQVQKCLEEFPTKQATLEWMNKRQTTVRDINHLLQIDRVLMWLVS